MHSPLGKMSNKITPLESQNTVAIIFLAECCTLNFFATGEEGYFHVIDCRLDSGVVWFILVSSDIINVLKKAFS